MNKQKDKVLELAKIKGSAMSKDYPILKLIQERFNLRIDIEEERKG